MGICMMDVDKLQVVESIDQRFTATFAFVVPYQNILLNLWIMTQYASAQSPSKLLLLIYFASHVY